MRNKKHTATHDQSTYIRILNKIIEDGYTLNNEKVTHTENNKFEFDLIGQNVFMKALGYIEDDEIVIKYKNTGVWMH